MPQHETGRQCRDTKRAAMPRNWTWKNSGKIAFLKHHDAAERSTYFYLCSTYFLSNFT